MRGVSIMPLIGLLFNPFSILFLIFCLPILGFVIRMVTRKKRNEEFYKRVYMAVRQAISDSKKND